MELNRKLLDKRVILLGGTSGIGFATAEAAAKEGAQVVVVSSQPDKVEHALSRLPNHHSEGHVVDLTKEAEQQAFFKRIGEFDHLIFTAGEALLIDSLHAMDSESARRFFNLRYWGAFTAAKYGSPNIRPGGSISFTSGVAAARPNHGFSIAASICGAIEALTRALAVELRPLRVNAVSFGMIRTELWSHLPNEQLSAMNDSAAKTLPVGRFGEPEDAAEAFLYLMSERYATGQILVVDGGATLV